MKFGYHNTSFKPSTGQPQDMYPELRERTLWAEDAGFDYLTVMDHVYQIALVGPRDEPFMEGWMALAAMAELTHRVELGTLVTAVGYRNPALLARMFGTLDLLSGGRAFFGIGAGWNREEFDSYGYGHDREFPRPGLRLAQLREAVQIINTMWNEPRATYSGEYHSIRDAILEPKPLQRPRLMIAGGGERVMLRLVAEEADMCNFFGSPRDVAHKVEVLRDHCQAVGRDIGQIEVTKWDVLILASTRERAEEKWRARNRPREEYLGLAGTPDDVISIVREFHEVGVQGIFLSVPGNDAESRELFVREVMPAFR